MKIEITFNNSEARATEAYLQAKYKSRAKLPVLTKRAIREVVAEQAKIELDEAMAEISQQP